MPQGNAAEGGTSWALIMVMLIIVLVAAVYFIGFLTRT